jgi:hypothetical protein
VIIANKAEFNIGLALMNLHQRCQAVFKAGLTSVQPPSGHWLLPPNCLKVACIAYIKEYNAAINILISFMGNEAGQQWLRLLVFAALLFLP